MTWKAGQSGNPAGRRPNPVRERFMALVEPHVPEIVAMLVEAAKKGDAQAAAALLDRVWPKLKADERPAVFECAGPTLAERGESVLGAVARGDLSVTDGAKVMDCLLSLTRLVEADEIERRLKALEERA